MRCSCGAVKLAVLRQRSVLRYVMDGLEKSGTAMRGTQNECDTGKT